MSAYPEKISDYILLKLIHHSWKHQHVKDNNVLAYIIILHNNICQDVIAKNSPHHQLPSGCQSCSTPAVWWWLYVHRARLFDLQGGVSAALLLHYPSLPLKLALLDASAALWAGEDELHGSSPHTPPEHEPDRCDDICVCQYERNVTYFYVRGYLLQIQVYFSTGGRTAWGHSQYRKTWVPGQLKGYITAIRSLNAVIKIDRHISRVLLYIKKRETKDKRWIPLFVKLWKKNYKLALKCRVKYHSLL